MNNKLTIFGLSTVILIGLLMTIYFSTTANSAQNITPTFATSRYMLFSGTYQVNSGLKRGSLKQESGVFKIDTYTGKTWRLKVSETPSAERSEVWVLIKKDNSQQVNNVR